LTKGETLAWHGQQIRPDAATVIVVGDTTLPAITAQLEKHFGDWTTPAMAAPKVTIPAARLPAKPRVFLIDKPGAVQSTILVGQLVASSKDDKALDFDIANSVLGGEFSSRLNMNLREDKHWAYGAYSGVSNALGQRPWTAQAGVQSDKTIESIKELQREISDFATGKAPATAAEVSKIQSTEVRGLPGSYETARAVLGAVSGINRYSRPDDYVVQRKARIEAMTQAQVQAAAGNVKPTALTWVIVGDLAKIESGVRALNLGDLQVVDTDGKPVAAKK